MILSHPVLWTSVEMYLSFRMHAQRKQFIQLYKSSFAEKINAVPCPCELLILWLLPNSTVKYSGIKKLSTEYVAHDLMSEKC